MNKFKLLISVILVTIFTGCANKAKIIEPKMSVVELRTMQSKTLNEPDLNKVLKDVLQLLMDDNFEISNLDSNVGYFQAHKKIDGGREKYKFAWYDIYYPIAIYKFATLGRYVKKITTTVTIRNIENKSVVRASFFLEVRDEDDELVSRTTIEDKKFYQEFFAKLDKAVFLKKNNL
jgi:hypothetical protein